MDELVQLISDFYDNIAVEYANYHNKVTTPSLFKTFFKKSDDNAVILKYSNLLSKLNLIIEKVNSFEESNFKAFFIQELECFKCILQSEIPLYTLKKSASMNYLKHLSSKRLQAQQAFLEVDNEFKIFLNKEILNDTSDL